MNQTLSMQQFHEMTPEKRKSHWQWEIFFLSLVPAVANIFRSIEEGVGDYFSYYNDFMNVDFLIEQLSLDTPHYIIFYLINKLSFGTWAFFPLVTTFISYYFTFLAIYKYGKSIGVNQLSIRWTYCVILLNPQFFLFSGHMVKMWMAYSFCLCAFVYSLEKTRMKFYLSTFLALLCHAGSIFIVGITFLVHLFSIPMKRKFLSIILLVAGFSCFLFLLKSLFAGHVQSRLDSIASNTYVTGINSSSLPHLVLLAAGILCSIYLIFRKKKFGKQLCPLFFFLLFTILLLRENYMVSFRVLSFLFFIIPLLLLSLCENRHGVEKFLILCFLAVYFLIKIKEFSFFWG